MSNASKVSARKAAKTVRARLQRDLPNPDLMSHWRAPAPKQCIAAYWPIQTEVDIRLLCSFLRHQGHDLALPIAPHSGQALQFKIWNADIPLLKDRFGARVPPDSAQIVIPDIILLPLLAFTDKGERLGYGGGYYDRTLAELRDQTEVWACGIAYAGQEVSSLPTGPYDQRLDAVLTERGLKDFT